MNEQSDSPVAPPPGDTTDEAASRLEAALDRIAARLADKVARPPVVAAPMELAGRLDSLIERLRAGIAAG